MRPILLLLLAAAPAFADEVRGRVTQVIAGAAYVDVGADDGVAEGDAGEIRRAGARIADVEVVTVAGSQARLSVLRFTRAPAVGDEVVLRTKGAAAAASDGETEAKKPPEERPFEPLLERQKKRAEPTTERDILHGRLSVQQLFQVDNESDLDYSISEFSADGTYDRIAGSRWALRWSGNLYYRTGAAFDDSDLDGAELVVFDLSLAHPLGDGGFVRFGRFLPRTLTSAGYFDGADAEVALGRNVRIGGAVGFKPDRVDLAPSGDEPEALVYASVRGGRRESAYWSGSYGVFASAWKGELDRAALLIEQVAELGRLRLDATATIDFDVGSSLFESGTRLTQLDAYLTWRVARWLTLRGGADHWERLDTAAERDRYDIVDALLFGDPFWRSWVGAVLVLPARLRLDMEYAQIESEQGPTTNPWQVTLEHYDPFGVPGASVSVTVYGLEGFDGDGYGGLFNAHTPLGGGIWFLSASAGFRAFDEAGTDFEITDVRLSIDYNPSRSWQLHGGVQWLGGTAVDSFLVDLRVDFRF